MKKRDKKLKKACKELWSKIVKERDKRCRYCGTTKRRLNAHHIINKSLSKRLEFDLENGITLCVTHHTLGSNSAHLNPTQFGEWIKEDIGKIRWAYLKRQQQITEPLPFDWLEGELEKLKEGRNEN